MGDPTKLHDTFMDLDIERQNKKNKASEHAASTIPAIFPEHVGNGLQHTPNSETERQYPQTSLPARGINQLAAKLATGMVPTTNQPLVDVTLRPSDVSALQSNPEQKAMYQEAAKLIQDEVHHVLSRSNLRSTLFHHFKELIIIGDGMIKQNDGVDFTTHRFDNYVLKRDLKGLVRYAILREYASESEIPESIRSKVVDSAANIVHRRTEDLYPLYTEIERQEDGSWKVQQAVSETAIPDSEVTYPENGLPFYFSRWSHDQYDNYGLSLVEENYGDILSASAVRQALLDGYSISTMGFIGVAPGQLSVSMVKNAKNWDVLPFDSEKSLVFSQPQNVAALTAAESMDQRMTNELRRIFLMDVSAELTHERTTARQVIMAAEELNRATGGQLSSFDKSTLRPIVLTTIQELVKEGVFEEEVLQLIQSGDITIDVKSGIDALGRESQYRNVLTYVAEMGQTIPEALNQFDLPSLVRWAAKAKGVPSEILKSDEDIEREQQQQLVDQVNQGLAAAIPQAGANLLQQNAAQ